MTLAGMNVLVTGTSRGIGQAIARQMGQHGARVLCHARVAGDARRLADEVGGVPVSGDLSTEAGVRSVADQAAALAPVLHVIVHNAGVNPRPGEHFAGVDWRTLEEVLHVNTFAPLFLTQGLLPALRAAGGARVVVITSEAGQFAGGLPDDAMSYRVSKAAANAVSVMMARALAPERILVNAMHPGWVKTDMGGPSAPLMPEEATSTVLYLATLPEDGPTGRFFYERREIDW